MSTFSPKSTFSDFWVGSAPNLKMSKVENEALPIRRFTIFSGRRLAKNEAPPHHENIKPTMQHNDWTVNLFIQR